MQEHRRRVSTKSRRRRTQLNLVDEATAKEATDHLHYTLPRITLSAILHPLFPIVGQALRAPLLAPRLGETEGSVDPAGVPPRLLGQDTEEVPLRQALGIVQLLLRRRRLLLRVQGGDLLRVNAVREQRRVHLASLLGAHRHSRAPHGHAGLHARRHEGADRRSSKDNEQSTEHYRTSINC